MEPDDWTRRVREGLGDHEQERSASSRYELLEELGRGGMGVVHRARDRKLNRIVALKFLQSTDARDAKRFEREGQLAAQLSHPHIIPIHEVGELEGKPFIAMELVQGKPLGEVRLDPRRAAGIVRDAAEAVHHAHGQGVIHRDLKPGNLLLGDDGHVWVMDFGLARPVEHGQTLTTMGTVIGTPAFMAPEQAGGGRCDARSDVYSLGATLYYLLTHKAPFEGKEALDVVEKVRKGEFLPPRRVNSSIPRDVETIILKAMTRTPWMRYATMLEFADDLGRWCDGEPIVAKPPGSWARISRHLRRHKIAFVALGVALACSTAFLSTVFYRSWRQKRELSQRLRAARDARGAREWGRAAALYAEAQVLAPDDASLQVRRRAMEEMARALQAWEAREELMRRKSAIELPALSPPYELPSKKEPLWEAEDAVATANREISFREQEAEQAALTALSLDPTLAEARHLLTELYVGRYEEAWTSRNDDMIRWWVQRVRACGGEDALARVARPATLVLETRPAGATTYLFRYEERKRHLIPLPCDASGEVRERDIPSVDAVPWDATEQEKRRVREGTAYPLETSEDNRISFPIRLPSGWYVVLFRRAGYADTRYPVSLARGTGTEALVRLLPAERIPKGFVYVPAGHSYFTRNSFSAEGTVDTRDLVSREAGGFLMARFSVTAGEYLEFLNDRAEHSFAEAVARSPHHLATGKDGRLTPIFAWGVEEGTISLGKWKEDEPVGGISWHDAVRYADWYTKRCGRGTWRFRLPTAEEWERAARGADRRSFPWGDSYEPAFAATSISRSQVPVRPSPLERIGLFPADESPFGVRDTAGVIRNWTTSGAGGGSTYRICKGSDYYSGKGVILISYVEFVLGENFSPSIGIRLVADLPQGED